MPVRSEPMKVVYQFSPVAHALGLDKASIGYEVESPGISHLTMTITPGKKFADSDNRLYDGYIQAGLMETTRLFVARLRGYGWGQLNKIGFVCWGKRAMVGKKTVFHVWGGSNIDGEIYINGEVRQGHKDDKVVVANTIDWRSNVG